ncbi:MAG: MGH1-like glycoside hydrolase domain-containing protein [Nitrososphaeraceae archaeon]
MTSTDLEEKIFEKKKLDRTDMVNTNWLIYLGLLNYGYNDVVEHIKQGIFELVSKHGFREYYDPFTRWELGGKYFSWTEALLIDIIENK